jgi:CRISPR/Cas system CSM-associated protein Csm2 small subunit
MIPRAQEATMSRREEQIVLELKKLRAELRQATPRVAIAKLERIDGLLDERLDQVGSDVLLRRHLGEMLDPRDQASAEEWGTAG